jgi:hypothetical protein
LGENSVPNLDMKAGSAQRWEYYLLIKPHDLYFKIFKTFYFKSEVVYLVERKASLSLSLSPGI